MRNQERPKVFMQVLQCRTWSYHPNIPIWPNNHKCHITGIDTKSLIRSTTLGPSDISIIEKDPADINESDM